MKTIATAIQKITLSTSRDIPFNKLVLSQANVRRVNAGVSIEELAEDIARRGLLQSLNVRPVLDGDGAETGQFEVPAGGRRYRALERLVKQKRLAKTAPVPCVVANGAFGTTAEEDSFAENSRREDLHPLDQFRAFQTLRSQGYGEEEIAARHYVTPAVVRQRLRLAAVSEKLLDLYAADELSLEQLMAFSVTNDHARQEQVWATVAKAPYREAYQIRRMLTEGAVRASDKRARFVGIEAYEAAGGATLRDLFQHDDGGWLQDPALLDRLCAEKLEATAQEIATEGWKWVRADIGFDYGHTHGLRRLDSADPLSDADRIAYDGLVAEGEAIEEQFAEAEELSEEADQRMGEIEAAIAAFDARPRIFDPADIGRAGAFVSIDHAGNLQVERGYVRPADEAPVAPVEADCDGDDQNAGAPAAPSAPVVTVGPYVTPAEPDEDDGIKPLPDRLVTELTAFRTVALRDAVANHPRVAMTLLLHKLVTDIFGQRFGGSCLEASVKPVYFGAQPDALKESVAAKAIDARHDGWKTDLPTDSTALWDRLDGFDDASRAALLAHCVSFGVNALFERGDRYGGGVSPHGIQQRIAQADRVATAVDLDLVEAGWRPTADNYLGRVTKARILEAVREGKGEMAAQLIDHLKKGDMAKEAERLLADTGWLPEPLRVAVEQSADEQGDDEALPAFLDSDEDDTAADELASEHQVIAAE